MHIIIVGAGISGCATYLFLQKHLLSIPLLQCTVTIYEKHRPPSASLADLSTAFGTDIFQNVIGAGLGINPNGMRVLRELNIKIHDAVVDRGFVCKVFKFQTPNGWTLGTSRTGDQGHPEEFCVATSRHAIQQCLAEAIPKEVIQYAEVKLVLVEHGKKPVVVLADGAEHRADLVIGADGVRSAVKSGVFDAEDAKLYAPVYSYVCSGLGYLMEINLPRRGSCGVGGFLQTQLPEHLLREQSMTFTFGRSGSFGYAPVNSHSGDQLLWWSSYESEAPPRKREIDPNHIRRMLQARHQGWWDPLITTVLYNAKVDTVWPTWTLPDLP